MTSQNETVRYQRLGSHEERYDFFDDALDEQTDKLLAEKQREDIFFYEEDGYEDMYEAEDLEDLLLQVRG